MGTIFVTADTHFRHFNCATKWRGFSSMEEHDEHIVQCWNEVVGPKDTVYHIGDVTMRRDGLQYVNRLNGYKRLVLGNHDLHSRDLFELFNGKVFGSFLLKKFDVLLTHIPVEHNQLVFRFRMNVHGHIHDAKWNPAGDGYINANIQFHGYRPVAVEELLKKP